ncbi:homoserine dehydrogenase [Parvularcula bermudensis HTCC2503]|uniref:Homoserine dehydrogenase n=1 Tax=Parvularcula bermudensis (strain ATCC BAA-594 / HTCC2503 / KCTC 12087) TaxID=314260 RepID=E0TFG9_PARBH|nr:homoserine dehydrogenase [Parvularcula bermudensis HTCC2503]
MGLLQLLADERRAGRARIEATVTAICARDRRRDRGIDLADMTWVDDPVALAASDEIDVFVELMGGASGAAKTAVETALEAGKPVVTANKALIAAHGLSLARLAEERGTALKFEAAIAGGVPIVRGLRDGLALCHTERLSGILNGTCNFILDKMTAEGAAFDEVLKEAQEAGYAEADPSFDIDGIDAAHKLHILAMIAFDAALPDDAVTAQGITGVGLGDLAMATRLDRVMKLVAEARQQGDGLALRVTPALVPYDHAFAQAHGPGNAVSVTASPLGDLLFAGPGAGGGATAAAVAADLCTLARGDGGPVFASPAMRLREVTIADAGDIQDIYALRLPLAADHGALDDLVTDIEAAGVGIDRLDLPPSLGTAGDIDAIAVTTSVKARDLRSVLDKLSAQSALRHAPGAYPMIDP